MSAGGSASACIEAALVLWRQGNTAGATDQLKRALALEPERADGHALLSLCLAEQGRKGAATGEAELALATDPELPLARYALAFRLP